MTPGGPIRALLQGGYLHDVASAVFESVGDRASVQVVGGLSAEQAVALARKGLRAFVISGNLGLPDAKSRYGLPGDEIERHIRDFIDAGFRRGLNGAAFCGGSPGRKSSVRPP